ncbi:MAG: DUF2892 domain-containing protein [Verrucomicrobiae bacterium]|nr:DUF2892 domain-containing protein [Verrucomicrobiae bacterium]MCP5540263.1 DUF2892 domain-containing protein [Akkermansiaceae bacterium]
MSDEFWTCNIDRKGRAARILAGLACLGAAAWLYAAKGDVFWSSGLGALGLVALYEGLRGWCVLRAFGMRTPF